MSTKKIYSVTQTNEYIKSIITYHIKEDIRVKGEITNIKKSQDNIYFSLKDENSIISGVIWKSLKNKIEINNGDSVIIEGNIALYTRNGTYQLKVSKIDIDGIGNINTRYQKMKNEFEEKGYFSKKKEFPKKIRNIALLTAVDGAALQDILYVFRNNNFNGNIYIKNCLVQGIGCPNSVKEGIKYFNNLNLNLDIDILVITRGGGSIDDLMGYSNEEIIKTIYESNIFTISAIGHEIDNMLSDYAADYRAPTPSIAAETIIKYQKSKNNIINDVYLRIKEFEHKINSYFFDFELKINSLKNLNNLQNPLKIIEFENEKFENSKKKIKYIINNNIQKYLYEIEKLKLKNSSNNIKKNLRNGSVIIVDANGNFIENSIDFENNIKKKNKMKIIFQDDFIEI